MSRKHDLLKINPDTLADIEKIRKSLSEVEELSDREIIFLYEKFSDEFYCASWMILKDHLLSEFSKWLSEGE